MLTILLILIILAVLYVLSTRGRKGQPGLEALRGHSYAHRGLHDSVRPENSMAAFRAAVKAGYGIELDVHLLSDGELAVIHDSLLRRTTGAEGRVEDLTAEQLSEYYLEGTLETIPTFRQVLEMVDGKVPLIIELKAVDGNHAALAETVCKLLESYSGVYCIESFDPRCLLWLKKNRPEIIRGQLTENFLKGNGKLPWLLKCILTHQMGNFLTMPDFVAYRFEDRNTISNLLARKLWGMQGVSWTLRSQVNYDTALREDWIPIFEDFTP